jgi:signal peptidase
MEPAFQRGDILFLSNSDDPVEVGDIVVFKIAGRDIPIVHRVLRAHEHTQSVLVDTSAGGGAEASPLFGSASDSSSSSSSPLSSWSTWLWSLASPAHAAQTSKAADYLTKGDNNNVDDRNLYAAGQLWLQRGEILGRARASLPYLGMVTILLNDYPALKYVLVGFMGLFVLTSKEG